MAVAIMVLSRATQKREMKRANKVMPNLKPVGYSGVGADWTTG
jgi:hypothetical protein